MEATFGIDSGHTHFGDSHDNLYRDWLLVKTTNITDNILDHIDIYNKNVIFDILGAPSRSSHPETRLLLNFNVSIRKWKWFGQLITGLSLKGCLTKKQFTADHLRCMPYLETLYIGATDYPLFENEDITGLPKLKYLSMTGYGMVNYSKQFEKWLDELKNNGCKMILYIS